MIILTSLNSISVYSKSKNIRNFFCVGKSTLGRHYFLIFGFKIRFPECCNILFFKYENIFFFFFHLSGLIIKIISTWRTRGPVGKRFRPRIKYFIYYFPCTTLRPIIYEGLENSRTRQKSLQASTSPGR